jgi:muconolactone delta-isomerase
MENELMKENEMTTAIQNIQVVQGSVVFGAYEELKRQATSLAEQIRTVEVSDDNVKLSKKLLSSVNKRVKELEDKRISIKKMMLEPYMNFEGQVKEIVQIVKDADSHVRDQVKELEEQERMAKQNELSALWEMRVQHYTFYDLISIDDFLKPKHLTKTMSINAVEREMVQFLEQIQSDIHVLYNLDYSEEHIDAYLQCFNLGQAMMQVKDKKQRQAQIERNTKTNKLQPTESEIAFLVSVKVYNQKELKLLEMILKDNQFEYTTDKVVL